MSNMNFNQVVNIAKSVNNTSQSSALGLIQNILHPPWLRKVVLETEVGTAIGILTGGVGDIIAGTTVGGIEAGSEATAIAGEGADTGIAETGTSIGTKISGALSDLKSFISPTIKAVKYTLPIALGGYIADIGISTISEGLANLRSAVTGTTFTVPYQLNQYGMPTSTEIGGSVPISQPPASSSPINIFGDIGILLVLGLGGLIIYEVVKKV